MVFVPMPPKFQVFALEDQAGIQRVSVPLPDVVSTVTLLADSLAVITKVELPSEVQWWR